jgi:hypothetical protein
MKAGNVTEVVCKECGIRFSVRGPLAAYNSGYCTFCEWDHPEAKKPIPTGVENFDWNAPVEQAAVRKRPHLTVVRKKTAPEPENETPDMAVAPDDVMGDMTRQAIKDELKNN